MTDRLRLLILVFAYQAEATIERVLARIPRELADRHEVEILVIDDASTDRTFALADAMRHAGALRFPLHVVANPRNLGYGGNQKIGLRFALDRGFDAVALLHGDGQYAPGCLPALLAPLADREADVVLGSRMLTRGGARAGGMPRYKIVGNRVLTWLQNLILRASLSEYHCGYRVYTTAALRRIPFDLDADGFHFDTEIIVQLLIAGLRIRELPIPTHYGDEISRVKVFRYGWRVLAAVTAARLQEIGLFYDRKFDCRPGDAEARPGAARLSISAWARGVLSRHPAMVARLDRFADRYPGVHRALWLPARLAWWTVSLQLPRRLAAGWRNAMSHRAAERQAAAQSAAIGRPPFRLRSLDAAAPPLAAPHGRRMLCVTHVLPHPPRAGNDYRIARMLGWLARHGWEVLLLVCPLVDDEVPESDILQAAEVFPNLIVWRHDGTLLHRLSCAPAMLNELDGRRPRDFASKLGEDTTGDETTRRTIGILRAFCPDGPVELLLHLDEHFAPEVLLAEYVFMTRAFPLLRPQLRKVIDTIDVFSNKPDKVEIFGIDDPLTLATSEEARLLGRADLLLAIQPEEAADLRRLAPDLRAVEVGVDFDIPDQAPPPAAAPIILLVASDNRMNVKGLRDFLRFAWPLVRRDVPDAELRVAGSVGNTAEAWSPRIRILGRIDDLGAAYAQARVVINPAVAGTGLKIKTMEALCHLRPIVLWPSGVEGIAPEARTTCHIANDWFDFAQHVIRLVRSEHRDEDVGRRRDELARRFAADDVYASLADALRADR
jgi:glycosyltransferase involved in cell wall biosynthesis